MSTQTPPSEPPDNLSEPFSHIEFQVLRQIWDRLHRYDQHAMICLVGEEGSGKSLTSLRLAKEVDPTFNADRVIFDVADLLEMLNSGQHEPGQAFVLDEAGVSLGRRTWQERGQVLANQALQLIRSHNLCLFFTLPRLSELDSQTIGRLQAFFEITDKVHNQHVRGKWKALDPDRSDSTGTIYHKKPRVEVDGYETEVRVDFLKFRPPSGDFVNQYKSRKHAHQQEIYAETLSEMRDSDEEAEAENNEMSLKDISKEIAGGELEGFVSIHGGNGQPYIDADMIELEYGLSGRKAKKVKKLLEHNDDVYLTQSTHA